MEWQEWAEIAKKKGEIVTIAHPAWSSTYQQPEVLKKIKGGIRFCEIYNGACDSASKAGSQTSSGYPIYTLPEGKEIDYAWEILLDNGCVTWGTAVSDAHANNNLTVLANGCVKAKTGDDTTDSVYQNWYSAVYLPVDGMPFFLASDWVSRFTPHREMISGST